VSPTISNFSSRYVVVSGNIITGSTTSDKQVLDMYLGAGDFAFVNNVVDVTGFHVVVEDKTEFNAPANGTNARRSLVVDGNVITADCAAVQLQGSFGITQATFLDNRRGSAVVSNNIITHTNTDSEAMSLRFLNSAIVSDNVVNSPDAGASPAGCVILSNESAIVTGNKFHSGFASISIATTNSTAHTFSGLCKSVILAGNTFTDFDASAAVVVSGIDSPECSVSVTGNVARTGRAVSDTSRFFKGGLSNIGHFAMTGNSYETDINNAATPILLGTWLTKSDTTTGNSWQLRVTDLSTGPPTSGRWWRGDIARTNNPAVDVASAWTCITTGSFSSATDATGDTDGSTAVITGLADTSDFFVNDWVTLSAGMASAGTRSRIIAKTSTTVTLDTASTSAQSNVTLATVDPVFSVSSVAGAVVSAADVPLFPVVTFAGGDATPTVLNGKYFLTGGTTTIEDFDDGVVGQTITVKAKHSLQITDGGDLELAGNFAMTTGDTITLTMLETGKWSEISRSDIA